MMPPEIEHFYNANPPEDGPPLTLPPEFVMMDAMKDWNIRLDVWKTLHVEDQAAMMAATHVKRSIEGYQSDWYRRKAEASKGNK